MIEKTNDVVNFDKTNVPVLKDALDKICRDAYGTSYTKTAADALVQVDKGKMSIMDDGTNRRLYFETGEGTVGWIDLNVSTINYVDLTTNQTIDGVKTFVHPVIIQIENRTDDTGCTETGRIWLRTDL